MMFKSKIRRSTVRVLHSWHEAFASALRESDPAELIGRIEHAISAIERRCSEWEADPGSPAERKAILKCTSALKRLMKQEQLAGMVQSLQQLQSVNDESQRGQ